MSEICDRRLEYDQPVKVSDLVQRRVLSLLRKAVDLESHLAEIGEKVGVQFHREDPEGVHEFVEMNLLFSSVPLKQIQNNILNPYPLSEDDILKTMQYTRLPKQLSSKRSVISVGEGFYCLICNPLRQESGSLFPQHFGCALLFRVNGTISYRVTQQMRGGFSQEIHKVFQRVEDKYISVSLHVPLFNSY